MKRLLLLLPIIALATIQVALDPAKPPAPRSAQRSTPAPKNAPQNNLAEQFRQQKIDRLELKRRCNDEFFKADYQYINSTLPESNEANYYEITRYFIRYKDGRKTIYRVTKNSYGFCRLVAHGFLEESYYVLHHCDSFWLTGKSSPSKRMAVECYISLEGEEITVYEKKPWKNDIEKYTLGKKISGSPLSL
ncbi:hypothetical protein [Synechococcus sp. N32]|uniref:hypothetical protein n=1 Tax=Synechococcus sp. N32 TaxID=2575514 RepID=UPI0010BD7249|nr:hypothetical protein [Synechococcus sp. N32]